MIPKKGSNNGDNVRDCHNSNLTIYCCYATWVVNRLLQLLLVCPLNAQWQCLATFPLHHFTQSSKNSHAGFVPGCPLPATSLSKLRCRHLQWFFQSEWDSCCATHTRTATYIHTYFSFPLICCASSTFSSFPTLRSSCCQRRALSLKAFPLTCPSSCYASSHSFLTLYMRVFQTFWSFSQKTYTKWEYIQLFAPSCFIHLSWYCLVLSWNFDQF